VRSEVTDNGAGVPEDLHDEVFVIFQRLQNRDEDSGRGIGLALCKKIVERHGGQIGLESEPDVGSTFGFTMPSPDEATAHVYDTEI